MYGTPEFSGGGSARPLGFASAISPSSSGQYTSRGGGAPNPVPQRTAGTVQRTGRNKPAPKPKPKPKKPAIPNINKFLAGDTTYQGQLSDLQKQLEQFKTSNTSQRGIVSQDFATALKKLQDQRTTDLSDLQNDFAARGLLNSGLYTDALGKYNTDFQGQVGELNTSQQRSLSDLISSLAGYQTENSSSAAAARADAIRRRAQQYGIS